MNIYRITPPQDRKIVPIRGQEMKEKRVGGCSRFQCFSIIHLSKSCIHAFRRNSNITLVNYNFGLKKIL